MKIAILHSAFTESGGAERVILSRARYLIRLGHRVKCYAAAIDKNRCFPDEIFGFRSLLVDVPDTLSGTL
jgi:hypothetical protein